MYDPKDPFSLLNPYSAPNMLMKSSAAVCERHRQSVADSARFVGRMQSAGRSRAPAAFYHTADTAPVVTGWAPTETTSRRNNALESWVGFFIALGLFLGVLFSA